MERGNLRDCFVASLLAMTYLMSSRAEQSGAWQSPGLLRCTAPRNDVFDVIASGTEWSVAIFRIASRNDSLEVGCGRLEVRI